MDIAAFRRDYLRDLPLPDARGRPLGDETITNRAISTTAAFERTYALLLTPTLVRLGDAHLALPADVPARTVRRDAPNFDPRSFEGDRFVALRLPLGPVQTVLSVGLLLPGMPEPVTYPADWVQVKRRQRLIHIYPGRRASVMPFGAGGMAMLALNGSRVIPNAWQVAYVGGYTEDNLRGDDADVQGAVSRLLAMDLLIPGSADQHLAAGVSGRSVSVDGLSQNTTLMQSAGALKFKALIDAYSAEYQSWAAMFAKRRSGVKLGVL